MRLQFNTPTSSTGTLMKFWTYSEAYGTARDKVLTEKDAETTAKSQLSGIELTALQVMA